MTTTETRPDTVAFTGDTAWHIVAAIRGAAAVASTDPVRGQYCNVTIETAPNVVRVTATDMYRALTVTIGTDDAGTPGSTFAFAARDLVAAVKPCKRGKVDSVEFGANSVRVVAAGVSTASPVFPGETGMTATAFARLAPVDLVAETGAYFDLHLLSGLLAAVDLAAGVGSRDGAPHIVVDTMSNRKPAMVTYKRDRVTVCALLVPKRV